MPKEKHTIYSGDVAQVREWIEKRGGVAIWGSVDLSCPDKSWTTPRNQADGTPVTKPSWQSADKPARVITDPAEVVVVVPREVKRFRVGLRLGGSGLRIKLTDRSSERLRVALSATTAKYGDSWYEFDRERQEAVIFTTEREVPLPEWTG
jgi:hypothetical protein